jgi:hypothetical protein
MSTLLNPNATHGDVVLRRDMGLTGRVAVSWSVAGGLMVGGFLVAGMTLAGRLSGNALLLTAGALYVRSCRDATPRTRQTFAPCARQKTRS